jgi:DNA-binding CsgD family transcriptional regulator
MTIQTEDLPSREYLAQFVRKPEAVAPRRGKQGVRITDETIAKIRQLAREGCKPEAIAEMVGHHERSVRYYMRNAPKAALRKIPYAMKRKAGRLFRAGATVTEVAKFLGRTRGSVRWIRRSMGFEGKK